MLPERAPDERGDTNSSGKSEPVEPNIRNPPKKRRQLGWARGEFNVPDDFDAPLPKDIEDSFY